jgi:parvulin-like peptidyl-prolyl isomerase
VASELKRKADKTLANAFRKKFIADKFPVSDKDIADYYHSNLEEFRRPLKMRVRSIQVETRQEAEEILKELQKGTPFGQLAQQRSIHPSAPKRGESGWFGKGEKDSALEKVALSLEKGQVSDIIEIEAGYEIIKLMATRGGEITPLENVSEAIKMKLINQRFQKEKQRYYEKVGVKVLAAKPPVTGQ